MFAVWGTSDDATATLFGWTGNVTAVLATGPYISESDGDEGWEQKCTVAEMNLVVTGSQDDAHCSTTTPDESLEGCGAGYYQPFKDPNLPAKACPQGYFCPREVACPVQCIQGSQCLNSTWSASAKECVFPEIMEGTQGMLPIAVVEEVLPISKKKRHRSSGGGRGGRRAPSRALSLDERGVLLETYEPGRTLSEDTTDLCPGAPALSLCGAGHYCPNALTSFPCPKGFYCPTGSVLPKKCSFLSSCTRLSVFPNYWMMVVVTMASMAAVYCVWIMVLKCYRDAHRRKREAAREHLEREGELLEMTNISKAGVDPYNPWSAGGEIGATEIGGGAGKSVVMEPPPFLPLASFRDKRGRTQLDLKFDNLKIQTLRSSHHILKRVSGRCRPGRITAIMVRDGKEQNMQAVFLELTRPFLLTGSVGRRQDNSHELSCRSFSERETIWDFVHQRG